MDALTTFAAILTESAGVTATLKILAILLVGWIVNAAIHRGASRVESRLVHHAERSGEPSGEARKRAETLVRLARQGVRIALWLVIGLTVLREAGIEIGPILASAGILGLAVGFGAQNLVRDVISGFFFILENQVRVGDVAVVNGTGGLVERVNFRTMVLRDLSGTVHVFPNGTINTLANLTREWSAYVFDIGVDYREDVDRVIDVMRDVGAQMKADAVFGDLMLAEPEIFGLDQLADSAVIIKGRIRTLPIKQWDVGREYLRRIKQRFDNEGITIPFPQRTLSVTPTDLERLAQLSRQDGGPGTTRQPAP